MNIFCDIDGTLTDAPSKSWGKPNMDRIEILRRLVAEGHTVVLWSARGGRYAMRFAKKYDIPCYECLGKPSHIIDDNPNLRPKGRIKMLSPEEMEKEWPI